MITGRGWNRWAIAGRSEMLTRWELATPQRRAEEWGAPRLRSVIEARQRAGEEVAKEERLSRGKDLQYALAPSTIEGLVKEGLVSAAADRDPAALSAAVYGILKARCEYAE